MIKTLQNVVTDNPWAYALPAGLVSSAYVIVHSPQPGALDFGIVLWAGLVAGLLTRGGSAAARRLGARTGLVASLPVLWEAVPILGVIPTFDQPAWFGVVQVGMLLTAIAVAALFVCAGGMVGAAVGEWLSRKAGRSPPQTAVQG